MDRGARRERGELARVLCPYELFLSLNFGDVLLANSCDACSQHPGKSKHHHVEPKKEKRYLKSIIDVLKTSRMIQDSRHCNFHAHKMLKMKSKSKLTMTKVAIAVILIHHVQFIKGVPLGKTQSWTVDSILASSPDIASTRILDMDNFLGIETSKILDSIKSIELHSLECSETSNIELAVVLVSKVSRKFTRISHSSIQF